MKKLICLFVLFFANQALADRIPEDNKNSGTSLPSVYDIKVKKSSTFGEFFFKPSLSIEYNATRFVKSGVNSSFRNAGTLINQLEDLNNVAIGGNFRVHKYLGFNANWAQGEMVNNQLQGQKISSRANYSFDQYNLSALLYVPAIENFFEAFLEGGVTDMRSRLKYGSSSGAAITQKSHETLGFYGAGFQFILNENDTIRVSWQRYSGRVALLGSEYTTTRIGYLRAF